MLFKRVGDREFVGSHAPNKLSGFRSAQSAVFLKYKALVNFLMIF